MVSLRQCLFVLIVFPIFLVIFHYVIFLCIYLIRFLNILISNEQHICTRSQIQA